MRKKKKQEHGNHERWLVSYADFITLLFAFFVVLYSSAQVDKRRVGQLALAIQVAFQQMGIFQASNSKPALLDSEPMPFSTVQIVENAERNDAMGRLVNSPQGQLTNAPARELMTNLQNQLESALSPEIKKHTITVSPTREGIVVSLKEAGFFDSGSAAIRPDTLSTIAHFIGVIRPYPVHIRIEGHTDNVPIHTARFDSNWELSTARATEMIKLFIAQFGIAPNRLSASGYGEYYPIASNDTPEGRAQNRRVDLVLLNPTAVVAPPLPRIPTVIPRLPRP
ncbi:MAG TPA: flagellar motor protein MotB [Candidatus Binatia bacterium]|nr:flagellar motor protein MotB [Candidatus Binatia bacterium]